MELRPVEGIRAVGPVDVRRAANDVAPAVGVEAAGQMEEDSYDASAKRQDRGLEEDAEAENGISSSELRVAAGNVDVLA